MSHADEVEGRFLEELASRPDDIVDLAMMTRRAVAKTASGCSEILYHTHAVSLVFSFTGKLGQAFIHIAVYEKTVNLGFNQGTSLEDEAGLLEGTGKSIRHVPITSAATLRKKGVKVLVREAVEQGLEMAEAKGGVADQSFTDKAC